MHLGTGSAKGWIALKEIFSQRRLNTKKIQLCRKIIGSSARFKDVAEVGNDVITRRERMMENNDVQMVLRMIWRVLSSYLEQPACCLSEEGYMEINIYIQRALLGDRLSENDNVQLADADFRYDTARLGSLFERTFFDSLYELIEMWVGSTYGRLVASFSWALLDSIIDVDIFPPKFRPIYEVTNVTDKTESDLFTKFSADRGCRKRAAAYLEWCDRQDLNIETQNRLKSRRRGITLNSSKKDLVYLQYRIDSPSKEGQQKANPRLHYVYDGDTASVDSDDENPAHLGFDDEDEDNRMGAKSRWKKLHTVLKCAQSFEMQKRLEEEEEALRQRAALSPVKKISMQGRDSPEGKNRRTSNFLGSGKSGSPSKRKAGFSSTVYPENRNCNTLLREGADEDVLCYHITSKNTRKPLPFSPARPTTAKSVVKPDYVGLRASKFALDEGKDREMEDNPASPLKYKQARSGIFRHNSFSNFRHVSRFERVSSPKKGPLKKAVHAVSSLLFQHPHYKPSSSHIKKKDCFSASALQLELSDDSSDESEAIMEDFLVALRDSMHGVNIDQHTNDDSM